MPIFRDAAWGQRLILQDLTGDPINLTGVPLRMQFREYPDHPTALIDMSTANGLLSTSANPTGGVVDVHLGPSDTATLPKISLYWDLIRTDTNVPLCGGRVLVDQVVTR
ncbi:MULTISPECIES: hypothetical protein [unclassified Beijerinckia]|uniref:hypothetical protein n=1 Tax=unclassified Beijerinckia TaxID=2638183 RepID=UPI00089B0959|nr:MULTISPECIES: hypothetical protein [unclassified Beijerinckia]MDH7796420.1 hypothetical protein [Beijerinckia sp. GAS462]SEC44333.1 hypothetical protein SAMN05443249_2702 [Beijerinckia sp. 28-YEA-48]